MVSLSEGSSKDGDRDARRMNVAIVVAWIGIGTRGGRDENLETPLEKEHVGRGGGAGGNQESWRHVAEAEEPMTARA
jgi:hypothetical protein